MRPPARCPSQSWMTKEHVPPRSVSALPRSTSAVLISGHRPGSTNRHVLWPSACARPMDRDGSFAALGPKPGLFLRGLALRDGDLLLGSLGLGAVGRDFQRSFPLGDGVVELPAVGECVAERVVSDGVVRLLGDRVLEVRASARQILET